MPGEPRETIKESLLANAPKSTWRAMNFAIYTISFVLLFLVGCVFVLVLKTSVVNINLSTAKTEYFKDKAKVGKVKELLTKMDDILSKPYLTMEKPYSTTVGQMSHMEEPTPETIDVDGSVAGSSASEPRKTPTPIVIEGDSFPPANNKKCDDPRERDIEELKQEIQELQKDEVPASDILQKF